MESKANSLRLLDAAISVAFLCLPVAALFYGLLNSGVWQNAVAAWQGEYKPFGLPSNPWNDILSTLIGLAIIYLILMGLSKAIARIQVAASLFLVILGSIAYLVLFWSASIVFWYFGDWKIGAPCCGIDLPVIVAVTLTVFILHIFRVLQLHHKLQSASA